MDWVTEYIEEFQYVAIALVLFLAGLGVPIPEDIPLIYGGVMAGQGKLNVTIHFLVSMVFILVGDTCLYFIGKKLAKKKQTTTGNTSKPNHFSFSFSYVICFESRRFGQFPLRRLLKLG